MKIKWHFAAVLALMLALVSLVGCSSESTIMNSSNQQEGIWVNGEGKVAVVPDIVNLSLGIQAQEASVAQAQSEASQAMDRVMTVLKTNAVAEKDIQTQYFSIQKVTRWDDNNQREVVIGYLVTNIVNAKIRDVGKVGTVIDAVAEAGGDLTTINNIDFSVDNPETYYQDIREEAIADAKAKAEQLATLSGVNLGKPIYISESIQSPIPIYPIRVDQVLAPEASTPISSGETEISLNVQVVYAILK
ncbi:MAG: SIMPL domain-containing protein [Dehalococcoidales bacterium]|nr:SIMPL domain-containing protein [Dehalococcoidales bacterium]